MTFLQAFRAAWDSLRTNKTRTALTLLGMVIGVFAIIASVTAVKVIDIYFNDSLDFFGTSTFSVTRYAFQVSQGDNQREYRPAITYEEVERLKRLSSAALAISPLEDFDWAVRARYGGRQTDPKALVFGTDENFLTNFSYDLDEGRPISEQDVRYGRPVALIGSEIAEELFPNESPLGKDMQVGQVRLQVIGVLQEQGSFLGYNPDTRIYAPITYMLNSYGDGGRNIAQISVRASSVQAVPAAMEEVIGTMRTVRKVPAGEDNNFDLETNDNIRAIFDAFTGLLTLAGAGIGLIALLAAGIGIMNIMLVSVTERTREIGIRKAVGAKRRDITRQFLLEAFFLCQIGGLLGILLGGLFGNLLALYFDISAAFPWGWALGGAAMVTAIALLFGGYPAYKAARLDPIESLRYE